MINSMNYLPYFLISIFFTTGVHGYLLFTQRTNRQWSLSVHAAKNRRAYYLYIAGHIFGGVFLIMFAYQYFYVFYQIYFLFYVTCLGVLFEYIQALLPAKGKTNGAHTAAAYLMWVLFTTIGIGSYFLLPLNNQQKLMSGLILTAYLLTFIYAHLHLAKLYLYQMMMTTMLSVALLIMII